MGQNGQFVTETDKGGVLRFYFNGSKSESDVRRSDFNVRKFEGDVKTVKLDCKTIKDECLNIDGKAGNKACKGSKPLQA